MPIKFGFLSGKEISQIIKQDSKVDEKQRKIFNDAMKGIKANTKPNLEGELSPEQIKQCYKYIKHLEENQENMIGKLTQDDIESFNSTINNLSSWMPKNQMERLESLQKNLNNSFIDYLKNMEVNQARELNNLKKDQGGLKQEQANLMNDQSKLNQSLNNLPEEQEKLKQEQVQLQNQQNSAFQQSENVKVNNKSVEYFNTVMKGIENCISGEFTEKKNDKLYQYLNYLDNNRSLFSKVGQEQINWFNKLMHELPESNARKILDNKITSDRILNLQNLSKSQFENINEKHINDQEKQINVSNRLKEIEEKLKKNAEEPKKIEVKIRENEEKLRNTEEKLQEINDKVKGANEKLKITADKLKRPSDNLSEKEDRHQTIMEETQDSGKCYCSVMDKNTTTEEEAKNLKTACNTLLDRITNEDKRLFLNTMLDNIESFLNHEKAQIIIPSLESEIPLMQQINEVNRILSYRNDIEKNNKISEPEKNIMRELCDSVLEIKSRPSGNEQIKELQIKEAVNEAIKKSKAMPNLSSDFCGLLNKVVMFLGFSPPFSFHKDALKQIKELGIEKGNVVEKEQKVEEDEPLSLKKFF